MISTTTPSLWQAMRALPLACRFGAAPPELRTRHAGAAAPRTAPADNFLGELHAALAALPEPLKARVDPLLLGVFYLDGCGTCAVLDVVAGGETVGTLVALGTDALDAAGDRAALRGATLRYLLEEAFGRVIERRRDAISFTNTGAPTAAS